MKLFLLTLLATTNLYSKQSYIDYVSPFHPVVGNSGMVASQNVLSSEIGIEILNKGGNAVDAAVAVGFSLAITLPRAGNLGGGGFMLVYIKERDEIFYIDYRSRSPLNSNPFSNLVTTVSLLAFVATIDLFGISVFCNNFDTDFSSCKKFIKFTRSLYEVRC